MTRVRLTAEDLWKLGESDTRRELVDGQIREMAPAGGVRGDVTGRICRRMAEHVADHGGGKVLVGDVGFVLGLPYDRERVRGPDVAFVSTARLLMAGCRRGSSAARRIWRSRCCPLPTTRWTSGRRSESTSSRAPVSCG
jgi:hypothetical protein